MSSLVFYEALNMGPVEGRFSATILGSDDVDSIRDNLEEEWGDAKLLKVIHLDEKSYGVTALVAVLNLVIWGGGDLNGASQMEDLLAQIFIAGRASVLGSVES